MEEIKLEPSERVVVCEICKNLKNEGYCNLTDEEISRCIYLTTIGVKSCLLSLLAKGLISVVYCIDKLERRIYLKSECGDMLFGKVKPNHNDLNLLENYFLENLMEDDEISVKQVLEIIRDFKE